MPPAEAETHQSLVGRALEPIAEELEEASSPGTDPEAGCTEEEEPIQERVSEAAENGAMGSQPGIMVLEGASGEGAARQGTEAVAGSELLQGSREEDVLRGSPADRASPGQQRDTRIAAEATEGLQQPMLQDAIYKADDAKGDYHGENAGKSSELEETEPGDSRSGHQKQGARLPIACSHLVEGQCCSSWQQFAV